MKKIIVLNASPRKNFNTAKLLKEAQMDEAVLKLKSYEALVNVANGQSTKIIVPSDLQNLATIGTTLKETMKDNK